MELVKAEESEPKNKGGRQSEYTDEIGDWICDLVATHPVGLSTLQKMFPGFPAHTTINLWRFKNPRFSTKYLAAKSVQAQLMVEEIDEMVPGHIRTYFDDHGNERIDSPSASLAIAKANNRKWTAARLAPKVYGDAKQIEDLTQERDKLQAELDAIRSTLSKDAEREF